MVPFGSRAWSPYRGSRNEVDESLWLSFLRPRRASPTASLSSLFGELLDLSVNVLKPMIVHEFPPLSRRSFSWFLAGTTMRTHGLVEAMQGLG
jgi:hypothetical protein